MTFRSPLCLGLLAVTSCADFPRDPENTLERVRAERSFRVALVAPLGDGGLDPKAAALLQRIENASGATAKLERGDAEPLLNRLEEGELDMVIGRFEKKSPWNRLVSFSPPLRREMHGKVEFYLTAAARNGENAWIGLIERETRNVAPEAQ